MRKAVTAVRPRVYLRSWVTSSSFCATGLPCLRSPSANSSSVIVFVSSRSSDCASHTSKVHRLMSSSAQCFST